jgi:stress response protein YsnF
MNTIVGTYRTIEEAQKVVNDLVNAGIDRDNISLVASDADGRYQHLTKRTDVTDDDDVSAGEGALVGGLGGGLLGFALGLGALAIPGIGPVLAFGPLVGALVGAGAGAVTGGLAASLIDMGIDETDAHTYAEAVRRGYTLVTVHVPEEDTDEARAIMSRYNVVDIDERADFWGSQGWTGYDVNAKPFTTQDIETEHRHFESDVDHEAIPVVEEEIAIGKREVEQGGIRVRSYMTTTPIEEQVELRETRVHVERRPVDRPVTDADLDTFQEKTIEVTETAEEAVVEKKARVVEEVVVNKDTDVHTETIRDQVRRTEVEVENLETTLGQRTTYDTYLDDFRTHYRTNYANNQYSFNNYEPAYKYGYGLAGNQRYQSRTWADIEPDVRRDWENRGQGAWEDFKDSIRYAWERAKAAVR